MSAKNFITAQFSPCSHSESFGKFSQWSCVSKGSLCARSHAKLIRYINWHSFALGRVLYALHTHLLYKGEPQSRYQIEFNPNPHLTLAADEMNRAKLATEPNSHCAALETSLPLLLPLAPITNRMAMAAIISTRSWP